MPGKSQHARRRLSRKEKEKKRLVSLTGASQQQAAAQAYKPVAPAKAAAPSVSTPASKPAPAAPSVSTPASKPAPAAVKHPYIASELRRISILAGIMLAILITLSLVLP